MIFLYLIEIMDFVVEQKLKCILDNFVIDCTIDTPDAMTIAIIQLTGVFLQLERYLLSADVQWKGKQIGRKLKELIKRIENTRR